MEVLVNTCSVQLKQNNMEELNADKTREMWNRYWMMKNKYNNVDEEGNPLGRGEVPTNEEDKAIYHMCNHKMRDEKFKNWRAIINEAKINEANNHPEQKFA